MLMKYCYNYTVIRDKTNYVRRKARLRTVEKFVLIWIYRQVHVVFDDVNCNNPMKNVRSLKLYCRYEYYTKPCMINCIWGLKTTMTSGESTCLISFERLR